MNRQLAVEVAACVLLLVQRSSATDWVGQVTV
jgi:hypothetical protein